MSAHPISENIQVFKMQGTKVTNTWAAHISECARRLKVQANEMTSTTAALDKVPPEIMLSIADHLPAADQIHLAETSRSLRSTIYEYAHGLATKSIEKEKTRLCAPQKIPPYGYSSILTAVRLHVEVYGFPSSQKHIWSQADIIAREYYRKKPRAVPCDEALCRRLVRFLFFIDNVVHRRSSLPLKTIGCACIDCRSTGEWAKAYMDDVKGLADQEWGQKALEEWLKELSTEHGGVSGRRKRFNRFKKFWIKAIRKLIKRPLKSRRIQQTPSISQENYLWTVIDRPLLPSCRCVRSQPGVNLQNQGRDIAASRRAFVAALGGEVYQMKRYVPTISTLLPGQSCYYAENKPEENLVLCRALWHKFGSFRLEDYPDAYSKLALAKLFQQMQVSTFHSQAIW